MGHQNQEKMGKPLDFDDLNKLESKYFKHGMAFPPAMRVVGFIVLFTGLVSLIFNFLVGMIAILLGIVMAFSSQGFQLDGTKFRCRECFNFLGFKTGDWKDLDDYPDIALRYSIQTSSAFSRAMVEMETGRDQYYMICLLNSSHRERLVVQKHKIKEEAEQKAKELSEKWDKKLTVFNPKISAKTQLRKRMTNRRR